MQGRAQQNAQRARRAPVHVEEEAELARGLVAIGGRSEDGRDEARLGATRQTHRAERDVVARLQAGRVVARRTRQLIPALAHLEKPASAVHNTIRHTTQRNKFFIGLNQK